MRVRANLTRPLGVRGYLSSGRSLLRAALLGSILAGVSVPLAAPAGAVTAGITGDVFISTHVGVSTVQFNWTMLVVSTAQRTAQIGPPDCLFGTVFQSSRTFNNHAIFGNPSNHSPHAGVGGIDGSTAAGPLIANSEYCFRVSTQPTDTSAWTTTIATWTLPSVAGVQTKEPTPNSPSTAMNVTVPVYTNTNTYYFKASTGAGFARDYRSTWTTTQNYTYLNTEPVWTGVDATTFVATAQGTWYHHVFPRNGSTSQGPFISGSTRTVQTFHYDNTLPVGNDFRHINTFSTRLTESQWNNTITPSAIRLSVQDTGAGLNTLGYSSGTNSSVIGLWHFDEGSGSRVANDGKDISFPRGDIDGVITSVAGGTKPYFSAGRFGSALNFRPGLQGYVSLANQGNEQDNQNGPLNLGGANSFMTVSAWIRINTTTGTFGTENYIVGRWDNQTFNRKYLLLVTNSAGNPNNALARERPAFYWQQDGIGTIQQLISPNAIPVNTWTHVAAVVNGSDGNGNSSVALFVNGVLSTSTLNVGTFLLPSQPQVPTIIGSDENVGAARSNYFDGMIDEVKITATRSTAETIALDYSAGIGWTPNAYVSSDGGNTWDIVTSSQGSSLRWSMTPDPGHATTVLSTFTLLSATLKTSTSTLTGSGATNQVRYVLTDLAGNELSSGPYGILVDTTTPVASSFHSKTSTQGVLAEADWLPLATGVTAQITVQDVTSGLDLGGGTYSVDYSTNDGLTYATVLNTTPGAAPYIALSGTDTTNAAQTLTIRELPLVQSVPETKNRLRFTVRDEAANQLNTSDFVIRVDTTTPAAISTITTQVPYAAGQIRLDWTATGNNGVLGTLNGAFHIAYTTTAAQAEFLTAATAQVVISTSNVTPGTSHFYLLTGLQSPGVTYYFRIFAKDPASNFSPLSAGATATTLSTPPPPNSINATVLGESSVVWNWSFSVLTSSFSIYSDTNSVDAITSVSTTVTNFTRVSLSTNTQYGLQLRSHNPAGPSSLTTTVQKYTFAARPGQPSVTGVGLGSFTFTWDTRGNPGITQYEVTAATSSDFATPVNQIAFAQGFTAAATTFAGLGPGATHFIRIQARNNEGSPVLTALSPATTPYTLPTTPSLVVGTALGVSSITWTWDSNGSGAATLYRVRMASGTQLATSLFYRTTTFTQTGVSTNTATAITVESLVPMTTSLATLLSGGLSAPTTIYTHAAQPGAGVMQAAATTSLNVVWQSSGNPNITRYEVTYGEDPAFTASWSTAVAFAAAHTSTFTSITGLTQGTSYYFRVRAQNNDDQRPVPTTPIDTGYGGTGRSPTVPVPVTGVFTNVQAADTIKWTWGEAGNGGATQYKLTQTGVGTVVAAHVGSTFTRTGLLPNVQYDVEVEPFVTGVATVALKSVATGAFTLANPPVSLAVLATSSTTATLQWGTNSNSASTQYQVRMSTDLPPLNPFDESDLGVAGFTAMSSVTLSGLAPFTTHFFRVRARNGNLLNTAFSTIVSTFTGAPVVSGLTATAQGVSSITWTWEPVLNASGYDVYMASWNVAASSPLASPTTNSYTLASLGGIALSTNAAYGLKLRAFNTFGTGPLSAAVTRYTHAAVPGTPVVAPVSTGTVSLSWDQSGNPGGTRVELSQSVDGFAAQASTPIGFGLNFTAAATTFVGLSQGTTYTFRLRARNDDTPPVMTDFSATESTRTLAQPGQVTDLAAGGFFPGRIDLTWTSRGWNGTDGVITDGEYVISVAESAGFQHSTYVVVGSSFVIVFPTSTVSGVQQSTTVSGLAEGTTYTFAVFLRNDEHVYSVRSTTATLIAPRSVKAFTVSVDTSVYALGPLATSASVVIATPVTLVSTGNVSLSYVLSAGTATAGSPWAFSAPTGSPGAVPAAQEDRVRLFGAFNASPPGVGSFTGGGIENILSGTAAAAGATRYSLGGETGENIPPAINPGSPQTRKLWLRLDMPPYTTTGAQQDLRVTITAQ